MKIEIIDKVKLDKNLNLEIKSIIKKIASNYEIDRDIEVIFVSDEEIVKLNKKNRGLDKVTNVLSFPQSNFTSPAGNILGSIVIAPIYAESRDEKIQDLVIHGMIHLLGADHEQDQFDWDKLEENIYKLINQND